MVAKPPTTLPGGHPSPGTCSTLSSALWHLPFCLSPRSPCLDPSQGGFCLANMLENQPPRNLRFIGGWLMVSATLNGFIAFQMWGERGERNRVRCAAVASPNLLLLATWERVSCGVRSTMQHTFG